MQQSYLLGTKTRTFTENNKRYIDEDNDIYPPMCFSSAPSRKVYGIEQLYYPICYFKMNRVREILIDIQKNPEKYDYSLFQQDFYKQNLINWLCSPNHPTNISYDSNYDLYEKEMFMVLENITPSNLSQLFSDLQTKKSFDNKLIFHIFKELNNRPHMLIALWNYGLIYHEEDIKEYKFTSLTAMLRETMDKKFIPKKRYYLLLQECPITHQKINRPAIIPTGKIFEYDAIKKHLLTSDFCPVTREKLEVDSNRIMLSTHEYIKKPIKTLYLPEENRFEHIN